MTRTLNTYDNQRIDLTYETRDIGYGVEAEIVTGKFTGEVDYIGKRTFIPDHTPGMPLYFFDDEIVDCEVL